jgi:hypothetical protein
MVARYGVCGMAGRPCKVCEHQQLRSINRQLALGVAIKTVAMEYGLSNGAVGRHKLNCASIVTPTKEERVAATRDTVAAVQLSQLLPNRDEMGSMLLAMHARLDNIALQCEAEGSSALAISAIDKMRLQLQDVARLQGLTGTGSRPDINVNVAVGLDVGQIVSGLVSQLNTSKVPTDILELALAEEN